MPPAAQPSPLVAMSLKGMPTASLAPSERYSSLQQGHSRGRSDAMQADRQDILVRECSNEAGCRAAPN